MATPAALPPLPFNPGRIRTYLVRLPLFTRLVLLIILAFWLLEFQSVWGVIQWGALIPEEINLGTSMFDSLFTEDIGRMLTGVTSVPT
jgi:glycosylphosphatidylinositol transamidase